MSEENTLQDQPAPAPPALPSFSKGFKTQKITIDNEEYLITEMNGTKKDSYLTQLFRRSTASADGKSLKITDAADMEIALISRCLTKDGKLVPVEELRLWPASTLEGLEKICRKLSALDKKESDEEKKD